MQGTHLLDKVLSPGTLIEDRYKIIEPLQEQGSYSRSYWVENVRLGVQDLLKVNVSCELVGKTVSERARYGLQKLSPQLRAKNEATLLSILGGNGLPSVRDVVHLPLGLEGVVYNTMRMIPLSQWTPPEPWWHRPVTAQSKSPYRLISDAEAVLNLRHELCESLYCDTAGERHALLSTKGIRRPLRESPFEWVSVIHNDLKPGNIFVDPEFFVGIRHNGFSNRTLDIVPLPFEQPKRAFVGIDYGLAMVDSNTPVLSRHDLEVTLNSYGVTIADARQAGLLGNATREQLLRRCVDHRQFHGVFGSASYSDPRTFLGPPGEVRPMVYQDAWSLGAIHYELLTRKPFKNQEFEAAVREWKHQPDRLKAAIQPLIDARIQAMRHEWLAIGKGVLGVVISAIYVGGRKGDQLSALEKVKSDADLHILNERIRNEFSLARKESGDGYHRLQPKGCKTLAYVVAAATRRMAHCAFSSTAARAYGISTSDSARFLGDRYFSDFSFIFYLNSIMSEGVYLGSAGRCSYRQPADIIAEEAEKQLRLAKRR